MAHGWKKVCSFCLKLETCCLTINTNSCWNAHEHRLAEGETKIPIKIRFRFKAVGYGYLQNLLFSHLDGCSHKKIAAKLLGPAKRVWKIKLAFSDMANAFTSSFSSGFPFMVHFLFIPSSPHPRWLPHSNSSSLSISKIKLHETFTRCVQQSPSSSDYCRMPLSVATREIFMMPQRWCCSDI